MRKLIPLTALATILLGASVALADGGDVCAAPTIIGGLPYTDSGTTVGKANNISLVPVACNGVTTLVNGPDVVYAVTMGAPPNNVTFSLDPTGANWDPSIYVLTNCSDGATCAAGYGDDNGGANITESITLTNVAAGTYFFYVDSFYPASNGLGQGTYTLSVTGNLGTIPPTAPVATNGMLTTAEDMAGTATLAATDANGDMLTYSIVAQPPGAEGSVSLAGNIATFTPAANFNGTSSFTFRASDPGGLNSNTATVSVTVTPVNDTPTASNQMQSTMEDTALDVTLMGMDVDVGDTLVYAISTPPPAAEGTVTLLGNVATFTPAANFNGTTSFTFHAMDAASAMSMDATVTIDVTPVNDPPSANAQSGMTMEDTPLMLTLTGSDIDVGDTLSFSVDTQPAMGQGMVMIAGDMATFVPGPNFNGQTSFTFIATDSANGMSMPATVTIDVSAVNDAPVVNDGSVSTNEDMAVDVTLTGSDVDMGDAMTYELVTPPPAVEGTVTLVGDIVTFTPAADFNGQTSFTFIAKDSSMTPSTEGKVNIMVGALDDPPVFVDPTPADMSTITVEAGQTASFTITATDVDSTPTYNVKNAPAAATVDMATGVFSWATTAADLGTHAIKIEAADAMSTITRDVTIEVKEAMGMGGAGGAGGAGGGMSTGGMGGGASTGGNGGMGMGGGGGMMSTPCSVNSDCPELFECVNMVCQPITQGPIDTVPGCSCTVVGSENQKAASGLLFGLLALLGIRRRKK
jgi:MYXO-CTERM domain-containing protein